MPKVITEETALAVKKEESSELATTNAAAVARFEIESAIVIAKKFPRNEETAYAKIMKVCLRGSFADEAMYSFPRGDAQVEGPSVNLARELARGWGNLRYGLEIVRDDDNTMQIRGWAWDLETNTKTTAEDNFKKLIFRKAGGWIKPDERDLRELVFRRGAILERNCLLKLMPKDFIEDALDKCRETLKKGVETDPEAARKKIIVAFSEQNVTPEMLEGYLGHKLSECSPAEIANLRKIYVSLKDGNSTWQEYMDKKNGKTVETGKISMDDLKPGKEEDHRGHGEENLDTVSSPEKKEVENATKPPENKPQEVQKPPQDEKKKSKVKVPLTKKEKDFVALKIQETSQGIREHFGEDISDVDFDAKFSELSGGKVWETFIDADYDDVILTAGIVKERLKGLKK